MNSGKLFFFAPSREHLKHTCDGGRPVMDNCATFQTAGRPQMKTSILEEGAGLVGGVWDISSVGRNSNGRMGFNLGGSFWLLPVQAMSKGYFGTFGDTSSNAEGTVVFPCSCIWSALTVERSRDMTKIECRCHLPAQELLASISLWWTPVRQLFPLCHNTRAKHVNVLHPLGPDRKGDEQRHFPNQIRDV